MVKKSWLDEFRAINIEVLIVGTLDHQPLIFSTTDTPYRGMVKQKIFYFEAKWSLEEDGEQTNYNRGLAKIDLGSKLFGKNSL